MRVIGHELKKIFNLKMIVLLILISVLMYKLFVSFHIEFFPNGRPALDHYTVSVEMLEEYGATMNEQEVEHFKQVFKEQVEEANRYLQAREEFVEAGLTTYEAFRTFDRNDEHLSSLHSQVMFEESVDLFWELQAREYLMERYEGKEDWMRGGYESLTDRQAERIGEVIETGQDTSVFPYVVFDNYNALIKNVTMIILVSLMVMMAPLYISDKRNQVIDLQYTSATGRNLFKIKLSAALLSAFMITTIQLIIFFGLYTTNHVGMFLGSNINSVFNDYVSWFDLTFLQYIMLTVAAIYMLGMVLTLIVAFVSSMAPNYITVIGALVPIAFILLGYLMHFVIERLTQIRLPIYVSPSVFISLTVIGILLIILRWQKEKRADVVH